MSLRSLCELYKIEPRKYLPLPPLKADLSLVFGVQSNYIPYLRTACFSMIQVGELLDLPIVIITDDPVAVADPFIRTVADNIQIIDPAFMTRLDQIKLLTRLHKTKRADVDEPGQWASGTLLKWAAFQDFGTAMNLFLDADILFLGSIAGLVGRAPQADLIATVQFPNRLVKGPDGTRLGRPEIAANVRAILNYGKTDLATTINSGVMLINKRLMTGAFIDAVIEHSTKRKKKRLPNEQSHFSQYFKDRKDYTVHFAPGIYNFHEEFMSTQTVMRQLGLLNEISILHYAGSIKPWHSAIRPVDRFAQMVWHRIDAEAKSAFTLKEPMT